ncbi:MAG TPA: DUF4097 family beta strand repeat-containing protein [Gemmatimonadales bacterium]
MFVPTLALAALAALQQTDTTFAVRPGSRLEINNFGGEIAVRAWDRSEVRLHAEHSSRDRIEVSADGQVVTVKASNRRGPPQSVDYDITVPKGMALTLSGLYTDIKVTGVDAEISAETVQGEITVSGGSGYVSLKSVQGAVTLEGCRGRIEVSSVNEGVTVRGCNGDINAETVNGDIELTGIESSAVDASTVNGDITYEGALRDAGRYRLSTHDGDINVTIPARSNASVTVATLNGDFEACFPVQLTGMTPRHRFTITLGTGSAKVELESFNGDIKLRQPSQTECRGVTKHKDHDRDNDNQE